MGEDGAKAIAAALITNRTLTQLNLCKLSYASLIDALKLIDNSKLGGSGAKTIIEKLAKQTSLTHVNLGKCLRGYCLTHTFT